MAYLFDSRCKINYICIQPTRSSIRTNTHTHTHLIGTREESAPLQPQPYSSCLSSCTRIHENHTLTHTTNAIFWRERSFQQIQASHLIVNHTHSHTLALNIFNVTHRQTHTPLTPLHPLSIQHIHTKLQIHVHFIQLRYGWAMQATATKINILYNIYI